VVVIRPIGAATVTAESTFLAATARPEHSSRAVRPRSTPDRLAMPGSFDRLARPLRDLRISVTDRCNFRCEYCMPRELVGRDLSFLRPAEILTLEEITRLARLFVAQGAEKVRITGGEPLVRRDLPKLVAMLANIEGVRDLTLTTNGSLLANRAADLQAAGLRRVTVSLDSLDNAVFGRMNGVRFSVATVLKGIERAREVGLMPIKINMLVKRGVNESSVLPMARYARDRGLILRVIEYMDVGHSNGWKPEDVVPAEDLMGLIDAEIPLEPLTPAYAGEVATRWRYRDRSGEIGAITSVSRPFCGSCTRARVSAAGQFYTCLFATKGHDLRAMLRGRFSDEEIDAAIRRTWQLRDDRYSDLRSPNAGGLPKVEMNAMGG
jgi:cyclic pyranopterin phosphate synthase